MKKFKMTIVALLAITVSCLLLPGSAYSEQPIRKSKEKTVVFSEIKPSSADLKKIGRIRKSKARDGKLTVAENSPKQVYLVKIHVELPSTSMAIDLYFGDERITEYASFDGGVYFKVYEKDHLLKLYGKPVRFVYAGNEYALGASFPDQDEAPPSEQNPQNLPTLEEFLSADA